MAGLSVILPACNEAEEIGACLETLLGSSPKPGYGSGSIPVPMPIEVIVIANGCTDATAEIARGYAPHFKRMGWDFEVLERPEGGKMAALNAGEAVARHRARAYLDADVRLGKPLLDQLARVLQTDKPVYASGLCQIAPPASFATRAYARLYARVPFMTKGVPGCGLFGVSAAGRRRWGQFPDIISDDTFVRLSFAPCERLKLNSAYVWPLVEGFGRLVRVRKRQNAGVAEIAARFPELAANDDKPRLGWVAIAVLALREPVGFVVYGAVALLTRLGPAPKDWSRGR
ncbi:glycosyltransferase [uncultured Lentibacter sp.]|uniref:glycosyltransferase family 2 protein n=1 Tax=uncultured Lentibacter sp. TaxID=1659309 RepID=UPI002605C531|nr:glycosyltransferase [uncultured Lentibacter sp.]MCW1955164.1 glycosyltransferase [Roseobacter sp.]